MDENWVPAQAPAAGDNPPYITDQIIVYGVHLNAGVPTAVLNVDPPHNLQLQLFDENNVLLDGPNGACFVAAYGYAFEGQCYRLDKPKILVFHPMVPAAPAQGCGYDPNYSMWRLRPASRVIELTIAVDDLETLLLEANKPGKRPPNTYASHMRLAHRGGRIMTDN